MAKTMADRHEWTSRTGRTWTVWADGKAYTRKGTYTSKAEVHRDLVDEILRLRALVDSKK